MTNSTLPTLTLAETAFEHITKIILELEKSEIKILATKRCKSMGGLARMNSHAIQNLKFKLVITKGLAEVIGYI